MIEIVNLIYYQSVGTNGSGNLEFSYPKGIAFDGLDFFVLDTQNNRVQKITQAGSFLLEFGSDKLNNPRSISYYSGVLYITDFGNHRVLKYDTSGNYIGTFGVEGSSNSVVEFEFPCGISVIDDKCFIADRQNNRVVITDLNGNLDSFITGLDLPEGVCAYNGNIYVSTSGNIIKKYNYTGNLIATNTSLFSGYLTSIRNIEGVFCGVDNQNNTILFFNEYFEEVYTETETIDYPFDVCVGANNVFTLVQQNSVLFYQIISYTGLEYVEDIMAVTTQLYPTGRAFWKLYNSVLNTLHSAFAISESKVQGAIVNTQNNFFADNYLMSDESLEHWERIFGLQGVGTRLKRTESVKQRQAYPNVYYTRQNKNYIESQLQLAGFDVYIHVDYTYNPFGSIYGTPVFGGNVYGSNLAPKIIANSINQSEDDSFVFNQTMIKSSFYICGSTIGSVANISAEREKEFRDLVLKLKPAHSIAIIYINYI